jgi:hypothetical protein
VTVGLNWKAVDKFRISAFRSAPVTAAYLSTPHSGLVARLDLQNLFASRCFRRFQQASRAYLQSERSSDFVKDFSQIEALLRRDAAHLAKRGTKD